MSVALKNNRNLELVGFALIAVVILVVLPLLLDNFRLNLVGKYLTYALPPSASCCAGATPAS
jgi:urea transport system permease protein